MSFRHFMSFLVFLVVGTEPQLIVQREEFHSSLVDCLVEIIRSNNVEVYKMAIQKSAVNFRTVTELLHRIITPAILNVTEQHLPVGLDSRTPTNLALIFNRKLTPFDILNTTLWFTDTRFLLVVENGTNIDEVFHQFWMRNVINVYALLVQAEDVIVYTFEPYKSNCGGIKTIIIDRWTNGKFLNDGMSLIKNDMRVTNLYGCPINISIVHTKPNVMFQDECDCNRSTHIDGIEGKVLVEISKKINFNATYVIPSDGIGWGWIRPAPAGVVGEVFTGRSEFGFGFLAPTIERYEALDVTVPYNGEECVTYGVPRGAGHKRPTWLDLLFAEFPHVMWIGIFAVFILTAICFGVFGRKTRDKYSLTHSNFTYVFALMLGIPHKAPSDSILRILFISWVWGSFILSVAYQTSMSSKLTVPQPDPDINFFHELLASKLKLTGYNNMLRVMKYDHNEGVIRDMVKRFVVTNFDIDEAVDQIATERKIAHVRHSTTFLYYALINPKAKGEIHVMKDCIYRFYPSFVMKKYSPMLRKVNDVIMRLKEAGIIEHWRSEYIWATPSTTDGFVKLSMGHMKGLFFIVLIGDALSIVIFIFEVIHVTSASFFKLFKK